MLVALRTAPRARNGQVRRAERDERPEGVVKCKQYGDSYLVLKDCRLRCTFSPEDSANLKADRLAVLDFYGHVLLG